MTPDRIAAGDSVTVRVRGVGNSGAWSGHEVMQLSFRDMVASFPRPVLQLAWFARVWGGRARSR